MRKLKQEFLPVARKHIDCSVTLKNQKEGTFESIEQDLVERFPEFRDKDVGSKRLELALEYIVVSFIDEISRLRWNGKRKVRDWLTFVVHNHRIMKQVKKTALNLQDVKSADESPEEISVKPATPAIRESLDTPVIKEFLQSFNPSLLYLHPTFIGAGIVNEESLDAIAAWPRPNIVERFDGRWRLREADESGGRGARPQAEESRVTIWFAWGQMMSDLSCKFE
ncbi:hypothetical protein C8R45DRAFT_70932 [Mycena sanguinolenta]|nr:hypothetical protein C8R45DRAFT_70932 [Mycena sanguinolenta]